VFGQVSYVDRDQLCIANPVAISGFLYMGSCQNERHSAGQPSPAIHPRQHDSQGGRQLPPGVARIRASTRPDLNWKEEVTGWPGKLAYGDFIDQAFENTLVLVRRSITYGRVAQLRTGNPGKCKGPQCG